LPQCFPFALFGSTVEALGWMYVIERATLVHATVRHHLATYLPQVTPALDYLDAYRGLVGARWQDFAHALDCNAPTDRDRDALVAAAHDGFRCLLDWQEGHGQKLAQGA
jgi:heme oxygenase